MSIKTKKHYRAVIIMRRSIWQQEKNIFYPQTYFKWLQKRYILLPYSSKEKDLEVNLKRNI